MWPVIWSRERRALLPFLIGLGLLLLALVACRGETPPSPTPREVTRIVERTVVVTQVITRVVTPPPGKPTDLTLCLREEPASLDPLALSGEDARALHLLLARVLVGWDEKGRPFTQVFERVPTLENGDARLVGEEGPDGHVEVTYRIRPDIRWEDGTLLSSRDFRVAWEAAREGRGLPRYRALARDVEDVRLVDERTFTVVLRQGLMTPLYMTYLFGPYPAHAGGTLAAEHPLSFGPYTLARWDKGRGMVFTARANATLPPAVPTLNVRFVDPAQEDPVVDLLGGRCDVLAPSLLTPLASPLLRQAERQGLVHMATVSGPAWVHLDFNTWPPEGRVPFFADVRVRQAVLLSLDRTRLAAEATEGLARPMRSWLPESSWAFEALPALSPGTQDIRHARQLLAEAGWRDEDEDHVLEAHEVGGRFWDGERWTVAEGTRFRVTLVTAGGDAVVHRVAEGVRQALAAIGMEVQVEEVPASALWTPESPLRQRKFDLALFSWLPGPDPDGRYMWVGNAICRKADGSVYAAEAGRACTPGDELLYPSQIPRADNHWEGGNVAGWARAEASLAIYQATTRLRPQDRAPFYVRHQSLFEHDLPVIPLFFRPRLTAWRAGWTHIRPLPFQPVTWNCEEWAWEP